MCTGGRIRHHLKHNLWRKETSVVFVGYAAQGTLARQIVDDAESVRIFGDKIMVKAEIHTIGGFSAHADQKELLKWHGETGTPETTYLVHGEEKSMNVFSDLLSNTKVIIPEQDQTYKL
jgi:metallo-beta-lactamase family protein